MVSEFETCLKSQSWKELETWILEILVEPYLDQNHHTASVFTSSFIPQSRLCALIQISCNRQ